MRTAVQERPPQVGEVFGDKPPRSTLRTTGKEVTRLRKLCKDAFLTIARQLVSREDAEAIDKGKDIEKLTRPITITVGDRSFDIRVREYTAMHTYNHPVLHQDVHTSIIAAPRPTETGYILFNITQEY